MTNEFIPEDNVDDSDSDWKERVMSQEDFESCSGCKQGCQCSNFVVVMAARLGLYEFLSLCLVNLNRPMKLRRRKIMV